MFLIDILKKDRPKIITIIGMLFLSFAVFMIFASLSSLILRPNIIDNTKISKGLINILSKYHIYFAFIEIFLGFFLLFVSIKFLYLKKWSSIIMQIYSILSIICIIFFSIDFYNLLKSSIPDEEILKLFVFVVLIMTSMGWSLLHVICIILLNCNNVKKHFVKK